MTPTERLKAAFAAAGLQPVANPVLVAAVKAMEDAEAAAVERCVAAVQAESLEDPQDCDGDRGYMAAIADCLDAVRRRGGG